MVILGFWSKNIRIAKQVYQKFTERKQSEHLVFWGYKIIQPNKQGIEKIQVNLYFIVDLFPHFILYLVPFNSLKEFSF